MKSTMRKRITAPVGKIALRPWRTPVLSYLGSLMDMTTSGAVGRTAAVAPSR